MILKFVYGKEIHVYDLKPNENLDQVCLKIKQLFKRIPNSFILCYKNYHQNTIPLNSNQQFEHLMTIIKGDTKIFKLYIHDINEPLPHHTKSQQKIQSINNHQLNQFTQVVQASKQLDLLSQRFTNLNELQDDIERFHQMEKKHENSKNEVTGQQFQHLEDKDYHKFEQKCEKRQQLSDRQIKVALQQSSDPQQLKNSSLQNKNDKKKQVFGEQLKQIKKEQQPNYEKLSDLAKKDQAQLKLQNEQKVNVPQQIQNDVYQVNLENPIEEDYLQHDARCDICNMFPISGPRYKCVVCPNYDLCEKCQIKFSHEHPVLKINYSYQTPLKIDVVIPDYKGKNNKESKIVYQKINLQELNPQQRRQRVLSLASQISQLLNEQLPLCVNFVQANEIYTKQTILQMYIEQKSNPQKPKIFEYQQKPKNESGFGNIFRQVKDFIFK